MVTSDSGQTQEGEAFEGAVVSVDDRKVYAARPADEPSCAAREPRLNGRASAASNGLERMIEAEPVDDAALDRALIERWKAGDERAATSIVERHAPALARYAVRLGMADDADELVQDTFIRAFGGLEGFRADSSLRTWLFTIQRRLVIDRRRASARRGKDVDVDDDDYATTGYNALDSLVADETSQRIAQAMQALTRMQREVFTLRVQEGRSYKEIAEILGSSEGAARVHYHNAMRAVKEFLDE
jgi:RNA polymerase sigma-70 factor (ECF subfamily)